ncbi:MAG: metallophosphoesterase [Bacteroidaceae bacterium]|nr:metallophosphoesterase [Bacteroidaceae bacterium]
MKHNYSPCMLLLHAAFLVLFSFSSASVSAQEETDDEQPLLTLACISDIHTERGLITDINNIGIRGSFAQTLRRIKLEEKIDVMLLGGDCTSDATIPVENWEKVRTLIAKYTRTAFPTKETTPVIYVTGNHDYEVANWYSLPKTYNAADYYTYPMKDDIGELSADDAFYEQADNADQPKMTMLAAYHYVIHGFDFVILNCGKYQFKDAGHYEYSIESVQWIAKKLEEIYADNPDKTVFFALHIPFGDSNSIRAASKGMVNCESTTLLKSTLSKYPNLIMLYGHDHGEDKAYTRQKTSQRVTHYDTKGNIIDTYDDTHVDGALPYGYTPESGETEETAYYLMNDASNLYMGYDSYNIAPISTPKAVTATKQADGSLYLLIEGTNPSGGSQYNYIHIGSNGYYSVGDATSLYAYEVAPESDGTSATLASELKPGHSYMIIGEKNGKWYAISNSLYNAGGSGQRMQRAEVTRSADGLTISITTANPAIVWKVIAATTTPTDEETHTWSVCNVTSGKYLGFNTINISAVDVVTSVSFTPNSALSGAWSVSVSGSGSEANGNFLYSGSSGRFSANANPCPALFYRVTKMDDSGITGELATEVTDGEKYIIAVRNNNDQSKYYALTDEVYNGNRLVGLLVNIDGTSVSLSATATNAVWTIGKYTPNPSDQGTPSFFSAFMGSMRYYYNTIDPGDMPTETPNIVQALMVYVYKDRVELHMKNYNKSGTINGITVNKYLVPYISYREVQDPASTEINSVRLDDCYIESYDAYDLTGRKISKPASGLYIVNGKKVWVK